MVKRRDSWKKAFWNIVISKLVFLDESCVSLAQTRLYGLAPSNERVKDYVPDARFERKSILVSIKLNGQMSSLLFGGTLNGKLFIQYIKEFLSQILKDGDIVVLDNCTAHKVAGVREAIEACGAKVLYLPAYSPVLNPVELLWSKVKLFLEKKRSVLLMLLKKPLNCPLILFLLMTFLVGLNIVVILCVKSKCYIPQNLCLDAGFIGKEEVVITRGYILHIRPRCEEKKEIERNPDFKAKRWVVKVSHSFVNRFRKLLVRFEKTDNCYMGRLHFAFAIIVWRNLIPVQRGMAIVG